MLLKEGGFFSTADPGPGFYYPDIIERSELMSRSLSLTPSALVLTLAGSSSAQGNRFDARVRLQRRLRWHPDVQADSLTLARFLSCWRRG